jgi:kynurenine formamidase
MKKFLFCIILAIACKPQPQETITLSALLAQGKWLDLTYSFSNETIYWPNNPEGFKLDTQFNGVTQNGFYYASNEFFSPEHGGTHLDAPIHFAAGKWTSDQIPVDQLIGEAVVIDVTAKAEANPDYQITVEDVVAWEKANGQIKENAFVLFKTGWGKFYPDRKKYLGTDGRGNEAIAQLHFPSIHPDLASWIVQNRKIKAVGIDTASIDYGQSKDFKTHQILLAENILGFENIANLEQVPTTGALVVALPMKIKGGTGGPLRLVAWIKGN